MTNSANHIDQAMGMLLRMHRKAAGLSQSELGEAAGISFQQIQKYESGGNRVSISRLFVLAKALNVSPTQLITELEESVEREKNGDKAVDSRLEFLASDGGQRAITALMAIDNPRIHDSFADFLSALVNEQQRRNV